MYLAKITVPVYGFRLELHLEKVLQSVRLFSIL